jgi:hypothetical protein
MCRLAPAVEDVEHALVRAHVLLGHRLVVETSGRGQCSGMSPERGPFNGVALGPDCCPKILDVGGQVTVP